MSEGTKNVLKLIGVLVAAYIAYHLLIYLVGKILAIAIPVAILGGVVYVVYRASGGKPLMGGRRTLP